MTKTSVTRLTKELLSRVHVLITENVLFTVTRSGTKESYSRVITLSSDAHYIGAINFEDLQSK